mmetsp:Transcript_16717/g.42522  ORF Transcript_16717/g.42522 Transcript_16717/m.42522 type:complete len:467 (+) Transcript_16717:16-1416(+)
MRWVHVGLLLVDASNQDNETYEFVRPVEGSGQAVGWTALGPEQQALALPAASDLWPFDWPRARPEQLWRLLTTHTDRPLFTAPDDKLIHDAIHNAIPFFECGQKAFAGLAEHVFRVGFGILQGIMHAESSEDSIRRMSDAKSYYEVFARDFKHCLDLDGLEAAFGEPPYVRDFSIEMDATIRDQMVRTFHLAIDSLQVVREEDRSDLGDHFMSCAGRIMGSNERVKWVAMHAGHLATLPAFVANRRQWVADWEGRDVQVFRSEEMVVNSMRSPLPIFSLVDMPECCSRVQVVLDLLRKMGAASKRLVAVEVGVEAGTLARAMLRHLPLLEVHGVDPYQWPAHELDDMGKRVIGTLNEVSESHFNITSRLFAQYPADRAVLHRMTSVEGSRLFEDHSIDLVFVDGKHTYDHVQRDLHIWARKVKRGGVVCGHDFSPRHPGVVAAVLEKRAEMPVSLSLDSTFWWVVE